MSVRPLTGLGARLASSPWGLGILVALVYLIVALPLLGSYGATWDCVAGEYPYGERLLEFVTTGDERFLPLNRLEVAAPVREPHPHFSPGGQEWFQIYPFGAMASAVSCRLLWHETGLVPALQAHHLVIPLMVAGLLVVLVRFTVPRIGALAGIAGAVFLAGSPRFFGHAFNNLKDVPETCLYVLATLLGFVALTRGPVRWWVACGVVTGLALAQKANALFIPPTFAVFLGLVVVTPSLRRAAAVHWSMRGFLFGALAFVLAHYAVSPRYWLDPIDGPTARIGEILRLSQPGVSSGHEPSVSTYAPLYVLMTTPPVILGLAALGFLSRRLSGLLRAFLLAGLLVSVGRNMLPGARNFDGVRHFIEFYPYLCIAAGVGLATLTGWIARKVPAGSVSRTAVAIVSVGCLAAPVVESGRTHPNGICYFNFLSGGLSGAQASGIPGATDYWGNSYWQAFAWLNANAEPGARVLVPVGPGIAECIAPVRLREDLEFWRGARDGDRPVTYVTTITRRVWYGDMMHALEERSEPVHQIVVQGAAVLEIYRLDTDPFGDEMLSLWKHKMETRALASGHRKWLADHPEEARVIWAIVREESEVGLEATLARLREHLPEELHDGLETILANLRK